MRNHRWGVIDEAGRLEHCSRCHRIRAFATYERHWFILPERVNILNVLTASY